MKIQASQFKEFLERASLRSKIEDMDKALLSFTPAGLEFLSAAEISRAAITQALLPKEFFAEYETATPCFLRKTNLLTEMLNLAAPTEMVDMQVGQQVIALQSGDMTAYIVPGEQHEQYKTIDTIVEAARDQFLGSWLISKKLLERVVKAALVLGSFEVRIAGEEDRLKFITASKYANQEKVEFAQPVESAPKFTKLISIKLLRPVVDCLVNVKTELQLYENFAVFVSVDENAAADITYKYALATIVAPTELD
jgi:hypothetical protein